MQDGLGIRMGVGVGLKVDSIVAWNPETKEITSGPAKGQTAENEAEAILKHRAAVAAKGE